MLPRINQRTRRAPLTSNDPDTKDAVPHKTSFLNPSALFVTILSLMAALFLVSANYLPVSAHSGFSPLKIGREMKVKTQPVEAVTHQGKLTITTSDGASPRCGVPQSSSGDTTRQPVISSSLKSVSSQQQGL